MELARPIARQSPLAISGIKQTINYARDHSVSNNLGQIVNWNRGMLRPGDVTRAIQAKMVKEVEFEDLLQRADIS